MQSMCTFMCEFEILHICVGVSVLCCAVKGYNVAQRNNATGREPTGRHFRNPCI